MKFMELMLDGFRSALQGVSRHFRPINRARNDFARAEGL